MSYANIKSLQKNHFQLLYKWFTKKKSKYIKMDLMNLTGSGTQHKAHINIEINITRSNWLESFNTIHHAGLNSLYQKNCCRDLLAVGPLMLIINTSPKSGSVKLSDEHLSKQ